jgi:hypothetical protein
MVEGDKRGRDMETGRRGGSRAKRPYIPKGGYLSIRHL